MQPYVAYYRVSTQMQGKSGLGLDAQRRAVEQQASTGIVLAEFTEIESGKDDKNRPALTAALNYARENGATLLIAKLDRLSRDLHFLTGFIKENVPFIACDIPHANKFTLHIMGAVAEQERDYISERTSAAIREKIAQGQSWGTNKTRVDAADTFAQSLMPLLTELTEQGHTTPASIMRELNNRGVRTSTGATWGIGQVGRLIVRIGNLRS